MYKLLPYIVAFSVFVAIVSFAYLRGRSDQETVTEIKTITQTIRDQEVLNEIRNTRPDDDALINILLDGSF